MYVCQLCIWLNVHQYAAAIILIPNCHPHSAHSSLVPSWQSFQSGDRHSSFSTSAHLYATLPATAVSTSPIYRARHFISTGLCCSKHCTAIYWVWEPAMVKQVGNCMWGRREFMCKQLWGEWWEGCMDACFRCPKCPGVECCWYLSTPRLRPSSVDSYTSSG